MSEYLTVQEVADRMRCEHRTVRRAIKNEELEAAMIGGRWLIRPAAVDAWFDSKRAANSTENMRRNSRSNSRRSPSRQGDRPGSVARLHAMEGRG